MSESARQLRIGALRLRAAGRNDPGARLALSRLLDNADLWPAAMPPAAVMIVRRMADPAPGRLSVHHLGARVNPAWEQAARAGLEQSYRGAAHPRDGPIPVNAEAVLFADEVEMIACLLADMSRQEARQKWWWRTLLRELPDAGAAGMTLLLHRRAAQAPAVLQRLVEYGQAIDVVRALTPAQALAVMTAMAQAYAVSLPLQLMAESSRPAARKASAQSDHSTPLLTIPTPSVAAGATPAQPDPRQGSSPALTVSAAGAAPWREWLPASLSTADLSKEQACLLGVGLSLRRSPAVVRSPAFLRQLQDWWLAAAAPAVQDPPTSGVVPPFQRARPSDIPLTYSPPFQGGAAPPVSPSPPFQGGAAPPMSPSPPFQGGAARGAGVVSPSSQAGAAPTMLPSPPFQGGAARSAGVVSPDRAPSPINQPTVSRTQDMDSTESEETGVSLPPASIRRGEPPERSPSEAIEPAPTELQPDAATPLTAALHAAAERQSRSGPVPNESATVLHLADGAATELGGVWCLINLMVYLDLPDCFEDDWRLATRLGHWGTLEALARALLRDSDAALLDDPLWPALLELGERRADEPLGVHLPLNCDFRLPAAWLAKAAGSAAYVWAAADRRLRLWCDQDYLLAEVACEPASAAGRASAELRRYRPDDALILRRGRFADAPLARLGRSFIDGSSGCVETDLSNFSARRPLPPGGGGTGWGVRRLSPALNRWLSLAVPAIRWRLRRALADDEADKLDWLRQPGRLYVTSTHVDIVMSLDSVSIPLRLAGLDRDPGWLPDFGRIIRLHFE